MEVPPCLCYTVLIFFVFFIGLLPIIIPCLWNALNPVNMNAEIADLLDLLLFLRERWNATDPE